MTRGRREFPACDGLRALAAGSVLLFHVATVTGAVVRNGSGPYLFQLDVGVDVFFVLSGFLLYRPFVSAHLAGRQPPQIGRYFKRRFLRIFPAYWLALIAVLYLFHQATSRTTGDGIVFFSLTQIYSGQRIFGGLVPAWTLCTEIAFYAFLPLYAAGMRYLVRGESTLRVELIGVGALYLLSGVFRMATNPHGSGLTTSWLPSYLDVFALGMLLAIVTVAVEQGLARQWWNVVPADAAVWWGAAIALFVATANLGMPLALQAISPEKYFTHHLMAGAVGVLLVCPAVLHTDAGGRIREVLASRPLAAVGLISYGIYLWQLPWIVQAAKWMGHQPFSGGFWSVLLLSVPLIAVTAVASYVLVERPLLGSPPRETGGSGVAAAIPSETAAE
ncbi:MAG: acyltransferase [Chloroflexi bacterium]|nr:acyltransferase [Chloroflexota bacterium]